MKNLIIILIAVFLISCEKDIFPDLGTSFEAVSVEAMLTDQGTTQTILVTRTQPYFQNEFPEKISGAQVFVIDEDSTVFSFVEDEVGYTWTSPDGNPFGQVGKSYFLVVEVDGARFVSFSQMGPAPEIDSIGWEFEEKNSFIVEDYYLAQFYASDFEGPGDAYWIKAYKNGQYLNQPSEITLAFDAGFGQAGNVDGVAFIQPIRQGINPFDVNEDNLLLPPYLIGDSVHVEIYSISPEMFFFLLQVQTQINRTGGFGELFAPPIANVPTNIINEDENDSEQVVGFFNVSAVTSLGQVLTEELAEEARQKFDEGL
ncbi:MAG: hypothetical protein ACI8QD_000005 [Cyclobacteriaceae bacterium]|jgi:hypothetical protein